jgi:enoyl-CoA hydratase
MNDVLGGADESREALKQGHPQQSPEQFSETNAGWLHRRAFLAAGATATVLAASPSFAQNQPPVASAPTGSGAMPSNVRVERLDGSILLIGIRQESDRVELSSVIGLGRLMYMLDQSKRGERSYVAWAKAHRHRCHSR